MGGYCPGVLDTLWDAGEGGGGSILGLHKIYGMFRRGTKSGERNECRGFGGEQM